ncbi:MAG TPA: tRNA (adenosine(37)-N6)-threonylcarbamoyltransferase complex transferase subunit TsaD [Candidatus Cloacimonadota bacterium]|nr:tRNA (adenosine(37)-N6)-threonylcarbamoyltransferase complex transferase subunit TsaD [Candidatus Cloacimonadota bacterium]HPT73254.1 tRNA (adenosine(37)-N6)-threonylcarbamoyltransferase complex transferase subunit TsaD [Candidatus Cloacimonadota bacterium]
MNESVKILAIESSCDDTSVAIVDSDYNVFINLVSSQKEHNLYGGVVPELASRLHMKSVMTLTQSALIKANCSFKDISAIAVSVNPGLIGSLLVGLSFAKSLAFGLQIPLITVNHMLGHVFAAKLENPDLKPPYLALVVSGGHTELVHFKTETDFTIIGKTKDDAAGEAFDKAAKLLNLGYPGGPIIDKLSQSGDANFIRFPRGLNRKGDHDFSFSGLKTSIMNYISKQNTDYITNHKSDIAASVQEAIIDVLVKKTIQYAKNEKIDQIIVVGGVSANQTLRKVMTQQAGKLHIRTAYPRLAYCMDNAAMIGAAAIGKWERKEFSELNVNAFSTKGLRYL